MILCLRRLGKRYNNLAKQGSTNGNDSVLHTWAAIELASSLALHCPGRGVDKRGQWKNRSNGKFLFPVKALSKVLERSFMKNSKQKSL
jgi:hypothetical protein